MTHSTIFIEQVYQLIQTHFHPLALTIQDNSYKHKHHNPESKTPTHLKISVQSAILKPYSSLEKHRLMNSLLSKFTDSVKSIEYEFMPD